MKIKLRQKVISTIGVALIITLVIIKLIDIHYYPDPQFYEGSYILTENRLDSLNDELRVVNNKRDSLNRVKTIYIDGPVSFSGFTGFIGTGSLSNYGSNANKQSFIVLGNIGLKLNEEVSKSHLSFHTDNSQGYLTTMKFLETADGMKISYIDKKVPYNYLSSDNIILVRLNSTLLEILIFVLMVIIWVFELALFLLALADFFKFLLNISRNKVFEPENIKRLKSIAICMLILSVSPFLINGIIYLIFISSYSSEGIELTYSFWKLDVYYLMLAIISYIIYIAFKHGMTIQQENELTI